MYIYCLIKLLNTTNVNFFFRHNKFNNIPPVVYNLRSLEMMYFTFNRIKNIAPAISNLVNLRHMNFKRNKLETIPAEIGDFCF